MAESLCLSCGLCCNGVLFARVRLQPQDNAKKLQRLGLLLKENGNANRQSGAVFAQPCAALSGCECRIYGEHPQHCREFECLLLKKVSDGETSRPQALRLIRNALGAAEKVGALLRELGDFEETTALSVRFRRMAKRMHRDVIDPGRAALFSELTVSFHALNLILKEKFYPGDL